MEARVDSQGSRRVKASLSRFQRISESRTKATASDLAEGKELLEP